MFDIAGGRSSRREPPGVQVTRVIREVIGALSPSHVLARRLAKWPGCSSNVRADGVAVDATLGARPLLDVPQSCAQGDSLQARMGERADFMLGCGAGDESLGHDAQCKVVRDAAARESAIARSAWSTALVVHQASLLPAATLDDQCLAR